LPSGPTKAHLASSIIESLDESTGLSPFSKPITLAVNNGDVCN